MAQGPPPGLGKGPPPRASSSQRPRMAFPPARAQALPWHSLGCPPWGAASGRGGLARLPHPEPWEDGPATCHPRHAPQQEDGAVGSLGPAPPGPPSSSSGGFCASGLSPAPLPEQKGEPRDPGGFPFRDSHPAGVWMRPVLGRLERKEDAPGEAPRAQGYRGVWGRPGLWGSRRAPCCRPAPAGAGVVGPGPAE